MPCVQATRDGGAPSASAMQLLLEAGYSNAVEVEGGFAAWVQVPAYQAAAALHDLAVSL